MQPKLLGTSVPVFARDDRRTDRIFSRRSIFCVKQKTWLRLLIPPKAVRSGERKIIMGTLNCRRAVRHGQHSYTLTTGMLQGGGSRWRRQRSASRNEALQLFVARTLADISHFETNRPAKADATNSKPSTAVAPDRDAIFDFHLPAGRQPQLPHPSGSQLPRRTLAPVPPPSSHTWPSRRSACGSRGSDETLVRIPELWIRNSKR